MNTNVNTNQKGFTLLETIVYFSLIIGLMLAVYKFFGFHSETSMKTASEVVSLERARLAENSLRFYVEHGGLGTSNQDPIIVAALGDSLGIDMNPGFYTRATEDTYLDTSTGDAITVPVQNIDELSGDGSETITNTDAVILSSSGEEESMQQVHINTSEHLEDGTTDLKVVPTDSGWIRKGWYIGQPAKLNNLALVNRDLVVQVDGTQKTLIHGVEAFDTAYYYPDLQSWCYDASDRYPDSLAPGTANRSLDTNGDQKITIEDDTDGDQLIDGAEIDSLVDADGDGKLDGRRFRDASSVRVWLLVRGEVHMKRAGSQTFVVGRRVLTFNDGLERTLSVFDVAIRR